MRNLIFCGMLMCAGFSAIGQDKDSYIDQYKDIAISEMLRTGIPASIKLAQGIHESNCGKSELACKANNHFGIKCGNDWNGKKFNKEDDDFENGKLVKSCFREFRTVYDSYIAHSDFLIDPAKAKRYGPLFELDATDYKGWARGLSKAGYATDPHYANKIIDLIERYELYKYDSPGHEAIAKKKPKESQGHHLVLVQNDVKYALAMEGDTPQTFAKRNDMTVNQVIRYNDDIMHEEQLLEAGIIVYLQPKRNQFRGQQKTHLLKENESMVSISQKYGIRLDALLKRNGLSVREIPAPGQKIILKGKSNRQLRTINPYDLPDEKPEEPNTPENAISSASADLELQPQTATNIQTEITAKTSPETTLSKPVDIQSNSSTTGKEHTVEKGETLYSVARQHGMSLDELKKMNNLSADTIFIGQTLLVK